MPDEPNDVNNAVSYCKEAVQFSASYVTSCLPDFNKICWKAMTFVFFIWVTVTLIKIANTPLDG